MDSALEKALNVVGKQAKILVLPYAARTLPVLN
jgi:hypothetical protein